MIPGGPGAAEPSLAAVPEEHAGAADLPGVARVAAQAAETKAAGPTVVLGMRELLGVVDAFVVTSGRNVRQVRTIVEEVERGVREALAVSPLRVEGLREAEWVLLDYGDVVVHVFGEAAREYYDLEHLWASAPRVAWPASLEGAQGAHGAREVS